RLLAYKRASAPPEAVDESMKTRCCPFTSSIQLSCVCRAGLKLAALACAPALAGTSAAAAATAPSPVINERRVFIVSFMSHSFLRKDPSDIPLCRIGSKWSYGQGPENFFAL